MLSLTKFAAIARQYGVSFKVEFTATTSFVWVGDTAREWAGSAFMNDLVHAGARMRQHETGMRMTLESLT